MAMAGKIKIRVNERMHEIDAAPDTPLLYVLAGDLQLQGPRFGCGLAQCGSCSVLLDGAEIRSCVTPVSAAEGKSITTLEGLPAWYAKQRKLRKAPALHPVQQAMIDEQAVQCGYCFNGMIVQAAELLSKTPQPTDAEIRTAMNGHLCRCGSYPRVIKAIQRASRAMTAAMSRPEEEIAQEIDVTEVAR
jgi:aerobic-type carbon monoxide dehydrogenase small subunit (CoxS/CutS family)